MADFSQTRHITTIHKLGDADLEQMEERLKAFAAEKPIALVLPCLYSELSGPALPRILEVIRGIPYIREIIITMAGMDEDKFRHARSVFSVLPQEHFIIWNDGPRMTEIYSYLDEHKKHTGPDGKGRSCWLAYGFVISRGQSRVIALHDCDILTYERDLLARLCMPVANPNNENEFCKGYYARVMDNAMHGRTTRLFVAPFIWSLLSVLRTYNIHSAIQFLEYMSEFRYPLAGEFAMVVDLARKNRIPSGWGLEIGVLEQVYRNSGRKFACQSEIADFYEHKHQSLGEDTHKGLYKMTVDISKRFFRILAKEGVVMDRDFFHTLLQVYVLKAQKAVKKYSADAVNNMLSYDRAEEEKIIDTFRDAIREGSEKYLSDEGLEEIPNWNSVINSVPDILSRLNEAVRLDNEST